MQYTKAWEDSDFMNKEEVRSVRVQLELLRPRMVMDEEGIKSTTVIFGSARINKDHKMKKWYKKTEKFAKLMVEYGKTVGEGEFIITTGGGPGIMEAGNKGAWDANAISAGLSIKLPFEQTSNNFVSPNLNFLFNYFSIRKMHFLIRAKAVAVMPGGFGTLDELTELLTLIQTNRMEKIPIVLFGKDFWDNVLNFNYMVESGVISAEDLDLFLTTDKPREAVEYIKNFYE
jgi:uncharacterized protein (TIGR00730 family)